MGPNSWEFRSHIRKPSQLKTQILYLLAKSQELGLNCQMSLEAMDYCPNFCQPGIIFVSVDQIVVYSYSQITTIWLCSVLGFSQNLTNFDSPQIRN